MRTRILGSIAALALALSGTVVPAAAAGPGSHNAAEVNATIEAGIHYLDLHQNVNGSFGTGAPIAETALALVAYGVSDRGDYNNLSTARQTIVNNALTWLLGQQNMAAGTSQGAWTADGYPSYETGLGVSAIAFSKNAPQPTMASALAAGRQALINLHQGPTLLPTGENCSTTTNYSYCGGWNYEFDPGRSDESNTGFAMTGLKLSGGIPSGIATLNAGWQHNIQELQPANPHATGNDGGGSYLPGENSGACCYRSNGKNTGSMLFGYGYDGVAATDPGVVAGLTFGQDVLDVYELTKTTAKSIHHTGANEDGACDPVVGGCTWAFEDSSEGGYHYSLWSLSKGLGEYISPDLTSPGNWYAKVADLLITQQSTTDGSWPVDGRDDFSAIFSTGLSIFALGLAATPPPAVTQFAAKSYTVNSACTGIHLTWTNPNSPNYGGLMIRRGAGSAPTSTTDGTLVANVDSPATSYNDTAPANGTVYYGVFPYDTTRSLFGPGSSATADTVHCGDALAATAAPMLPAAGSTPQPPTVPVGAILLAIMLAASGVAVARRANR